MRASNMTAAAIDLNLLNELFDNQKKLDDLFLDDKDSAVDGDSFFNNSLSFGDHNIEINEPKDSNVLMDFHFDEDLSLNSDEICFEQKKQHMVYFAVSVVVEIAVISYGIMQFSH